MAVPDDEPPRLNRFTQYPYAVIAVPFETILAKVPVRRASVATGGSGAPAPEALEVP
jgi:hypothetical protein